MAGIAHAQHTLTQGQRLHSGLLAVKSGNVYPDRREDLPLRSHFIDQQREASQAEEGPGH